MRQHRHVELAFDVGGLARGVAVRPVAQERGVTGVERVVGLALRVRRHAAGCERADPASLEVEHGRGLRVVDRHLAAIDEVSSAARRQPLEGVASQALVGVALVDEPVEVRVRCPLAVLDLLRHRAELGPCGGWLAVAVLLQQVRAVVEDSEVAEPRHSDELAADREALDDALRVELRLLAERGLQVDEVGANNPGPDDVEHHHVVGRRLRRECLCQLRVILARVDRLLDELDLDPGLLGDCAVEMHVAQVAQAGVGAVAEECDRRPDRTSLRLALAFRTGGALIAVAEARPCRPSGCDAQRDDEGEQRSGSYAENQWTAWHQPARPFS